jgi:hypothetical protein
MMFLALLGAVLAGEPADNESGWRLVGVYDASAVTGMEPGTPADYAWQASSGMVTSCGPEKRPDGLGVFEATATANRLMPSLAIVLERVGDHDRPLESNMLRVGLTDPGLEVPVQLQPAVKPRHISAHVHGSEFRYQQLVRTQLAMELCLEHKTGRGWIGGGAEDLREAFLLDDRSDLSMRNRKYFGGQKEPIPALIGPPDACLVPVTDEEQKGWKKMTGDGSGKGESSLGLVPADLWGAALRMCRPHERGQCVDASGTAVACDSDQVASLDRPDVITKSRLIPLRLSTEAPWAPAPRRTQVWDMLEILLGDVGGVVQDEQVTLKVLWNGVQLATQPNLFSKIESDDPAAPDLGLQDILAQVPHTYPTVGPADDPDQFVVLIIPNWQLVEAIRRFEHQDAGSRPTAGDGVQDGVGWVLTNPDRLLIQVAPMGFDPYSDAGQDLAWPNLSTSLAGHTSRLRSWGYTTGLLSGRKPIALVSPDAPTWEQTAAAQRAEHHGVFLASATVLLLMLGVGISRLNHLWARVPEERVAYWPGRDVQAAEKETEAPEAPGAG